ncbi:MAG: hypothetical protein ABI925_02485 [Verrucomicrobiota bacterium]
MKRVAVLLGVLLIASGRAWPAETPKVIAKVTPLPMALSKDFQFRKTKLFLLTEKDTLQHSHSPSEKPGKTTGVAPSSRSTTVQDASISYERTYRLFGAVTALDRRQLFGHYFDFFWRARRSGDVTVRLEYRQEKLHAYVQAQEVSYPSARGSHKTEFRVVGDDYFDDGRVIAWRCLLIENGAIVAENRSYLWE